MHKVFPSEFLKRFLLIFLPVSVLFALALFALDSSEWNAYLATMQKQESARVEEVAAISRDDVSAALPAIYEIAGSHHLGQYCDTGSTDELQKFTTELLMLARLASQFDRLSFLDNTGQEIVRINGYGGYPKVVPGAALQDMSSRYYVDEILHLTPGKFYVSPIDLSQEHGKIVFPIKPTMRIGVPIFDAAGKSRGAIVVNLLSGRYLQKIDERNAMREDDGELMVLNREGYWLKGMSADDEWGFALGHPERTFGNDYPLEWKNISTQENGAQNTPHGLFVHATVHLPHLTEGAAPEYLKIVSYVPKAELAYGDVVRTHPFLIALLYLALAISTALLVSHLLNRERTLNIVEKKNAQLGDKKQRLESIIEGTRAGTWEWNVQTGETKFNQFWAEIVGYQLDELEPISIDTWVKLAHPDDMKLSDDLLEKHFAGKLPIYECEVRMRHKQGHWVWVHDRGRVTRWSADGKPLMMFGTHQDISQRKLIEERMQHVAHHDALTGLPNRMLLDDRLQQILASAKREQSRFAVIFLDLDEFKPVNDTYGHSAGDVLLREAARRMLECTRASDTVARVGGDEFVTVLARIQHDGDAIVVAEKMRRSLSQPFAIDGLEIRISSSIGIAIYPDHGLTEEALAEHADMAMYQAKKNGRNQVRLYLA